MVHFYYKKSVALYKVFNVPTVAAVGIQNKMGFPFKIS
jgi:hypothetical protein